MVTALRGVVALLLSLALLFAGVVGLRILSERHGRRSGHESEAKHKRQ